MLEVLVRKTQTIKRELGSVAKVIDDDIEHRPRKGIRHRDVERLADEIEAVHLDQEKKRIAREELEAACERQEDLKGAARALLGTAGSTTPLGALRRDRFATRCPARWSLLSKLMSLFLGMRRIG